MIKKKQQKTSTIEYTYRLTKGEQTATKVKLHNNYLNVKFLPYI